MAKPDESYWGNELLVQPKEKPNDPWQSYGLYPKTKTKTMNSERERLANCGYICRVQRLAVNPGGLNYVE